MPPSEQFTDALLVIPQADGVRWKLAQAFVYDTDGGAKIAIPAGFVTDFASVPRILWNILPPFGKYTRASVVHDFLYAEHRKGHGHYSRAYADAILLEAMGDCGVEALTRWVVWAGVRIGGWAAWKGKSQ